MAGVTDTAYRIIAHDMGCPLCYAEMVSSQGIHFRNERTLTMLESEPGERPLAMQIFANTPEMAAEAAKYVEDLGTADILDFNMGCPAPKISGNGSGSALMKNPALCGKITEAVVAAVDVPVTVKIRKGWDDGTVNAVEVAKICEQAGAAAITVHGRTRQQYYKPPVDYEIIRQVKQSVRIPVIANGDVDSAKKAKQVLDFTGADFVMVGRASLGNPWIFSQINSYLSDPCEPLYVPTLEEKLDVMVAHVAKMVAYKGEYIALRQARKLVVGYFKGVRGAASLRNDAGKIETMDDLIRLKNKALGV